MFFAQAKYDKYVKSFMEGGYKLMTQNSRACVFLRGTHWVEVRYKEDVEPINSIYIDKGQERPAPLSDEEQSLCMKIYQCMRALNK